VQVQFVKIWGKDKEDSKGTEEQRSKEQKKCSRIVHLSLKQTNISFKEE
jgi:hypothetical protein